MGKFQTDRLVMDELIGMCGLVKRKTLEDVDIGYGFLPHARGEGYALEAAQEIHKWAISELEMRRLAAIVNPGNKPSITLLEKLDMQFDRMIQLEGDEEEICLYLWSSLLKPDKLEPIAQSKLHRTSTLGRKRAQKRSAQAYLLIRDIGQLNKQG